MYNVFYVLLLEQDITKKKQVDKNNMTKLNVDDNDRKKYIVEAIYNSMVYIKESANYLPGLYYLVF